MPSKPPPAWYRPWLRWQMVEGKPRRIPRWAQLNLRRARAKRLRGRVVKWAVWGAQHEPSIHYSMAGDRDDWLSYRKGQLPIVTDCSGFCELTYKWGGAPDPSGFGYRAVGATGTILAHAARAGHVFTDVSRAQPGDIIVIGPGSGDHAVLVVHAGADPVVVSHGSEGGPRQQRLSVDKRTPKRVCRTLPVM